MTITQNFYNWCSHHGVSIASVAIVETRADRIYFTDPDAKLLVHGLAHGWDVSEPRNHGRSVILSLREEASPSMQVCVHRALDATTGKRYIFFEVDFDFAPPLLKKPKYMVVHVGEVILNSVSRETTDQGKIAEGLAKRGITA